MIGLKFLFMFGKVAFSVLIAAAIILLFFFVVTWVFRLAFEGFKVGISDHWSWFKGMLPHRRQKTRRRYRVYSSKGMDVGTTTEPEIWIERGCTVEEIDEQS